MIAAPREPEPSAPPVNVQDYTPDWAWLSILLAQYGTFLKPEMTALDEFLAARDKAEAAAALRRLQIQLEDEAIVTIIASA